MTSVEARRSLIDPDLKTIKGFALIWVKNIAQIKANPLINLYWFSAVFVNDFFSKPYIFTSLFREKSSFSFKLRVLIAANLKTIKEFALIWAKNIAQIKANPLMNLYWFSAVLKMIFAPNRIYLLHFFAKSRHFSLKWRLFAKKCNKYIRFGAKITKNRPKIAKD